MIFFSLCVSGKHRSFIQDTKTDNVVSTHYNTAQPMFGLRIIIVQMNSYLFFYLFLIYSFV